MSRRSWLNTRVNSDSGSELSPEEPDNDPDGFLCGDTIFTGDEEIILDFVVFGGQWEDMVGFVFISFCNSSSALSPY